MCSRDMEQTVSTSFVSVVSSYIPTISIFGFCFLFFGKSSLNSEVPCNVHNGLCGEYYLAVSVLFACLDLKRVVRKTDLS